MGPLPLTTSFTLPMPFRTRVTPIMPEGKDDEGPDQDPYPVVSHTLTPSVPAANCRQT